MFNLRISQESKDFLLGVRSEYGASAGVNRLLDALCKFCLTGDPEIDGVRIKDFFSDALGGKLIDSGSRGYKVSAAEEREYLAFREFMDGDIGAQVLRIICEKDTAGDFFAAFPKWIDALREEFLRSPEGSPLRVSTLKRYTDRWYREKLADGSAAEMLRDNILNPVVMSP